jgi:hypothetical protein
MKESIERADLSRNALLPECLDDCMEPDDPVRAAEACVEPFELRRRGRAGIVCVDSAVSGRP